jgi:hypothetical protein
VALRAFVARDHDAEAAEFAAWLTELQALVARRPSTVRTDAHFYPRLVIVTEGPEARELADRLAAADPPVIVPHAPLARGEVVVCPESIPTADRPLVERALAALD